MPIDVTVRTSTRAVVITGCAGSALGGGEVGGAAGRGTGGKLAILRLAVLAPVSPTYRSLKTRPPHPGCRPNTGGKTATLKALGLAVLAAKSGLPVPAAAPARLPCFDAVLADIGAWEM